MTVPSPGRRPVKAAIVRAAKHGITRALGSFGYQIVKRGDVHSLKEHLLHVLTHQEVDWVIDVGAYRGDYGSFLREAGYGGPIVSFEPVERSYRELARNSADDPAWNIARLALGSRDETREIGVAHSTDFSSFRAFTRFGTEHFAAETLIEHRERVEIRRLDGVLAQFVPDDARRIFLKLDTQGWDLEVLQGAAGCLDRIVALQLEVSARPIYDGTPTYLEALSHVEGLGFSLTDAVPVVRDHLHRVIEFDCVLGRQLADRSTGVS